MCEENNLEEIDTHNSVLHGIYI